MNFNLASNREFQVHAFANAFVPPQISISIDPFLIHSRESSTCPDYPSMMGKDPLRQ